MQVQGLTEESLPVTNMVISCSSEAKEPVTSTTLRGNYY